MFWLRPSARERKPAQADAGRPERGSDAPRFKIPLAHAALWEKLAAFPIDDPSAQFQLSMRLAKEQEWTHDFALRVIEEYRKFLFLSMVSPEMVTPSLRVDEAWHLHLLYTRSYWQELCVKTLGRLIHHQPSTGGQQEDEKFSGLYVRTLDLYAGIFGEPPEDIWGRRQSKPNQAVGKELSAAPVASAADDRALFALIGQAAERLKQGPV
jgi:hypothetical protein